VIRAELDARAARVGWRAMHAELARVDPATAARLAPTDAQRIQRALEVHALMRRPLSSLQGARASTSEPMFVIALAPADRSQLHAAIAWRFDAMLAQGLIDEVVALRERFDLHRALPSMRAVGYRQVLDYLDGRVDRAGLRERGIAATRQLAKRQLTWLRSMDVETVDCFAPDAAARVSSPVARALARRR
jgi:tRNA dimethylallyltransferase